MKKKKKIIKYKEPNRLEVLDKKTHRRVVILNAPGQKSGVTNDEYLFVACGDTGARQRKYPERGIVVRFDKFFAAMEELVDSEVKEWMKTRILRSGSRRRSKKSTLG